MEPESAVNAFANLDKRIYQGRIMTILPASKKKETPIREDKREFNRFENEGYDETREENKEQTEEPKEEIKETTNTNEQVIDEKSSFKTK